MAALTYLLIGGECTAWKRAMGILPLLQKEPLFFADRAFLE